MGVPGLLLGCGAGYTGRDTTGMRLHTATQPFAMHVPSQTVPLEDLDEDQVEAARSDSAPSAKTVTTLQTVVFAIFLDPPHPPTPHTHVRHQCCVFRKTHHWCLTIYTPHACAPPPGLRRVPPS